VALVRSFLTTARIGRCSWPAFSSFSGASGMAAALTSSRFTTGMKLLTRPLPSPPLLPLPPPLLPLPPPLRPLPRASRPSLWDLPALPPCSAATRMDATAMTVRSWP